MMGGYVAMAWSAPDLYPFSTFPMYGAREATASRVIARDAGGRVAEVDRFTSWRCDRPLDLRPEVCTDEPGFSSIAYVDQEAADYIASHGGDDAAAAPVDVVRRIWRPTSEAGPPPARDCLIQRCKAVAR
jgi:hypothetical protein